MATGSSTGQGRWLIHQLRVLNFKCFAEQSFDLADGFTVFIGDNGSGKTAVLEALLVGVGAFLLGIDGKSAHGIQTDYVRLSRYEFGQTLTFEPRYPVVVGCKGSWMGGELNWERTRKGEAGRTDRVGSNQIIRLAQELQEEARLGKSVVLPVIAHYGTGRLWRPQRSESDETIKPGSRFDAYDGCLSPESHIGAVLEWIKTQELISLQESIESETLVAVKEAIKSCVQGLVNITYSIRESDILATFDDGQELPFRLLSAGVRNMLAIAADIGYRAAVLNPHFQRDASQQTPGIVLIDEIDLHLHPKWQRRVTDDLRRAFPKLQFIAGTHSPFIIQALRQGELIDLAKGPTGEYANRSIEDIVEDVMGVDVPQRSHRYQQMYETATQYYQVLEKAEEADTEEKQALKQELDALAAPFSDNVAYHAYLNMKRAAAGLGDNGDASS